MATSTGVKYIGKNDVYEDNILRTGLTWSKGETHVLPEVMAKEFLKHPGMFAEVPGASYLIVRSSESGLVEYGPSGKPSRFTAQIGTPNSGYGTTSRLDLGSITIPQEVCLPGAYIKGWVEFSGNKDLLAKTFIVAAGDRLYVAVEILASDSSGTGANPASWTVTVNGGGALTPDDFVAAAQLYNGLALYSLDAPATGDLTLSVTPSGAARGCAAWAWKIKGHNTGTPHPSAPDAVKNEGAVATIVHPNALIVADGDVVLGVVGVKGGDVTALGVTGADGSTVDETGTSGFTDLEHGVCWKRQSGAGTVTFDWDWTGADGVVAGYWRIQKA